MGFGMLNGILSGLVGLLTEWISKILGFIMKILINILVVPIVKMLMTLIEYVLGAYFYSISVFLLNLLDFVQLLFRAFAGLPTDGITLKFTEGNTAWAGETSDPLMQIITSNAVKQAFLSMAIVGFFLLIITTIFQMIKVEYTTEGAKNSKTPILQKAFKGAANLVLLPLLVIFGVFIGNKVLDLLDTATNPGENTRMSDLLFTTAASDAFYKKSQFKIIIANTDPLTVTVSVLQNSVYLIMDTLSDTIISIFNGGNTDVIENSGALEYCLTDAQRTDVINKFMNRSTMKITDSTVAAAFTQGGSSDKNIFDTFVHDYSALAQKEQVCRYDNAVAVTGFFNYAKINYLLLIFSACLILKALFFTVFGLMMRLYKCAVLFIISPAVIGMTPVNEGGLGKWRSSFIGQVLSAYGTVLSVNLFLVLVKLMISVEITFDQGGLSVWGIEAGSGLSSEMMTGLIKSIMIIAGAYQIEKLSKDLGGYFGADDAMSVGKDAAKEVGAGATKALAVGAAVAGGGAMLMSGAVKGMAGAGKGIAGAMKDKAEGKKASAFKAAVKGFDKGSGINAGDKIFAGRRAKKSAEGVAGIRADLAEQSGIMSNADQAIAEEDKNIGKYQEAIDEGTARFDKAKTEEERQAALDDVMKAEEGKSQAEARKAAHGETKKEALKKYTNIHDDNKAALDADDKAQEAAAAERTRRKNKALNFAAGVLGMGESVKDMLPGQQFRKQWQQGVDAGGKLSDELGTATGQVKYLHGKEKSDSIENGLIVGGMINAKNDEAARMFAKTAAEQFAAEAARLQNAAEHQMGRYNALEAEKKGADAAQLQSIAQQQAGIRNWMADNDITMHIDGGQAKSVMVEFQTDSIQRALEEAVKKGANKEELAQIIKDEMAKIGKQGNDELIQKIIKEFEKTMSKFSGGK